MVIVNIECWGWLATCYHLSHSYESGVLVDGGGSCMNVTSKLWRGNWGETGAASSVIHHIGWAKLLLLVTQRWLLPIQCSLWGLHQVWCPTIVEVLVGQFAKEGSPCAVSTYSLLRKMKLGECVLIVELSQIYGRVYVSYSKTTVVKGAGGA